MANVLINPSYERNLADWTVNGGDGERLLGDALVGDAYMEIASAGTANLLAFTGYYPAAPGQAWSAGANVRNVDHVGAVRLDIRFVDSAFVEIAGGGGVGSNVTITAFDDFTQVKTENKPAPAGTVYVRMRFVVLAPSKAGTRVHLDGMQLEQGATLPAYNDPSGEVSGDNVLTNPSFEVHTLGWDTTQGDVARIEGDAADGFSCGELSARGTNNVSLFSELYPCTPGSTWSAGVMVKNLSHDERVRLDIRFYDAAEAEIAGTESLGPEVDLTGGFADFSQLTNENKVAPVNVATVRVRLSMLNPAGVGTRIRVDNFQLEQAAALPPYNPVVTTPPPPPVGAGINMLMNSSFELDFGGPHEHAGANWEGNPPEARNVRAALDAVHGTLIGVMTNPDGRLVVNWQSEDARYSSCVPGEVLTASIYFRKAAGSSTWRARLDIQHFDEFDEPIRGTGVLSGEIVPTTDWQRIVVTGVTPERVTHAQIRINMMHAAPTDVMEIDAAQLERGGSVSPYKPNPIEATVPTLALVNIGGAWVPHSIITL